MDFIEKYKIDFVFFARKKIAFFFRDYCIKPKFLEFQERAYSNENKKLYGSF